MFVKNVKIIYNKTLKIFDKLMIICKFGGITRIRDD